MASPGVVSYAYLPFVDPYGPEAIDVSSTATLDQRWPSLAPVPDELAGRSRLLERRNEANPSGAQTMQWQQHNVKGLQAALTKQVRTTHSVPADRVDHFRGEILCVSANERVSTVLDNIGGDQHHVDDAGRTFISCVQPLAHAC